MEELMQSRVKLLGSTALAAAALSMGASTASADGHKALEKRVKALERASGTTVTRSKKTMRLVVNGHINRAITFTDNGTESAISHVTSNFSRTRLRWIGSGKINDDLSVQTFIELGNQSAVSTRQDIGDNGDDNGGVLDERHIDLRITSRTLGRLYLGQGSPGGDGVSERDLSGTGIISLNGAAELIGGGETFQRNGADAGAGTVGANFTNMDNNGRRDRIRYDTPRFAGFQVTAAHANEDAWDIALRYGGSFGGVRIAAALGYADQESINGRTSISGSASVLFPMGLSLTVGAGDQDSDEAGNFEDDTTWKYAKVGYRFKGSELGETRLFVDVNRNDNANARDVESTYWGLGFVQIVEPLGMELYAVYHNFDIDLQNNTESPDDVDRVAVGARLSF